MPVLPVLPVLWFYLWCPHFVHSIYSFAILFFFFFPLFSSSSFKSPATPSIKRKRDADALSCINFSPDSKILVVGSRNARLYFLKYMPSSLSVMGPASGGSGGGGGQGEGFVTYAVGKGHASGLLKVDWSKDGTCVRSNADDRFLLYWNPVTGQQDRNSLEKRDLAWSTGQCLVQWPTIGMWHPSTEEELMYVDHGSSTLERAMWAQELFQHEEEEKIQKQKDSTMNRHSSKKKTKKKFLDPSKMKCCDMSKNGKMLVASDGRQRVALWRYPAVEGASCRLFAGHGSSTTDIRFACEDRWVVSVSGDDRNIIIW